jgi:hypothetical protein
MDALFPEQLGLFDQDVVRYTQIAGVVEQSASTFLQAHNPRLAAAFLRHIWPSRMYLRNIARERWPVCFMITSSVAPFIAAWVAKPERKL